MTETSPGDLQVAILLPLDVIASQLVRIEGDLRFLNMKVMVHTPGRDNVGGSAPIAARLEKLNELLELIRGLVSEIETDIQPQSFATLRSVRDFSRKSTADLDD